MNYIHICILSLIMIISSCGFYSFTGASISPDVKTISINYFENNAKTVKSSLSSMITEKLKDFFDKQTNLELIERESDLSFNGEIISYTIKPISIKSNETVQQNRLTIQIAVQFENKKDPKMNYNSNFSRYRDFPANEDLSIIEENLMNEITDELIEDVFNKAIINW